MVGLVATTSTAEAIAERLFAAEDDLLALGCRQERLGLGRAVIDPLHPSIYDVNGVRDVRGRPTWAQLEEAFRLVCDESGSRHRRCISRAPETIRHLDELLLPRSFARQACVAMVLEGRPLGLAPPRGLELYLVDPGDEALLEAVAHCQDLVRRDELWYARDVSRQMDEMARRQIRVGGAAFVAAVDRRGEVAGALLVYRQADVAFVADVGTAPRWRRKGVASALLCATASLFRERGCVHVGLTARRDDHPRRLYERLGFAAVGESIDWLRGP